MKLRLLLIVLLSMCCASPALAEGLRDGDRVAIIGDSITEQKLYSLYIEDYLLMCQPKQDLQTMQFGWGGETSWGFLERMDNDMLPYKPTVATTSYGMNDGGYGPLKDETRQRYVESMNRIVRGMKDAQVRFIVVGSPGAVDSTSFHVKNTSPDVYNQTLAELSKAARDVAEENGAAFADVHAVMMDVMGKAKAKFGKDYLIAADGVHPGPAGHLVMAYAYLKALGCDGDLGSITIDLKNGHAEGAGGHKILSSDAGSFEIESTRYPFCLTSDDLRQIAQLFPFDDDLNRLTLKVSGAGSGKVKVTWGGQSKVFSAGDLASGINLAAEFVDNPFVEPFKKVEAAAREQQNFETPAVKKTIHEIAQLERSNPEQRDALEQRRAETLAKQQALSDAARAAVTPVRHTLRIEPQ